MRSTSWITFLIILPVVLLVVGVVFAIILYSKSNSSDGKFLYKPSIYLQQEADPNVNLFPVLYKVVNNAGRYFIVKVYFKTRYCRYSVIVIELLIAGLVKEHASTEKTDLMEQIQTYHFFNPLTINAPYHIETSQLIWIANQLAGFYMMRNIQYA